MIYLDNSATTRPSDSVIKSMVNYLQRDYGNPSSLYKIGVENKKVIQEARKKVANCIGAEPNEIYFTSCGSESNNWALKGISERQLEKGKNKIITSCIEHPSVLRTCEYLETKGFEVIYLPVNKGGRVLLEELERKIDDKTAIVSIMYANNEIGTIQSIKEIGDICKNHNVIFHTDAVQAIGNVDIKVKEKNINLLSLSGHKFSVPKGIGVLYIQNGIEIENLIHGGKQENGLRAGTENIAYIVGLAEGIVRATQDIESKNKKIKELFYTMTEILFEIPNVKINGEIENRLSGNINISFKDVEAESLLLMLDTEGICVSAGSACSSGSGVSHVLKAIGLEEDFINGTIRISIGENNTEEEIVKAGKIIKNKVEILKKMRGR